MTTDDMVAQLEKTTSRHAELYEFIVKVRERVQTPGAFTIEQMVDFKFLLTKVSELCDDMRKECNALSQTFQNVACIIWTQANMRGVPMSSPIRGEHASGTPDVTYGACIPTKKKDPEGYRKLCEFFKIPEEQVELGIVDFRWPELMECISQRIQLGYPVPEGIDPNKTFPVYKIRTVAKRQR